MKDIDWKILKVLYDKKNITKTAQVLFMTQSALTKRLKNIEREWGVEVVHRTSKGVIFTEDGRYLAEKAVQFTDMLDDISMHFAKCDGTTKSVTIGVPNSYARLHLPKLLKDYKENGNALQIRAISNSSDVIIKQLLDESIDLGIVCGDYQYYGEKMELFSEKLYAVVPKGRSLQEMNRMPLIESYLNPLVKEKVEQWWKRYFQGMPGEVVSVPYSDIAIEMVENGLGSCFVFGMDWKLDRKKVDLIPIYENQNMQENLKEEKGRKVQDKEVKNNGKEQEKQIERKVWLMCSEHAGKDSRIQEFLIYIRNFYKSER